MPIVRLSEYVREENVFWDVTAPDKHSVLRTLSGRIANQCPGVDADLLLDLLEQRESLQSTGIGGGLALPHAMVPGTRSSALFVARVAPPVDYEALDGDPVDFLFLLLSPADGLREHVRLLARMARIVGQSDLLDRLRAAKGPEEALGALLEEDSLHVY